MWPALVKAEKKGRKQLVGDAKGFATHPSDLWSQLGHIAHPP